MRWYVVVRILSIFPALLGVSVAVFLLVRLIPGTVVDQMVGTEGAYSEESMRALRSFFGLDQPIYVQYVRWLGTLLRGDLGVSWRTGLPVLQMIVSRLLVTVELTFGAMVVALAVGVPLGMLSARRENTTLDHVVRVASLFSLSIPVFWQATMLILAVSLWLDWAPAVDFVSPWTDPLRNLAIIALPSLALGTAVAAVFMRMTRSSLLEVMRQDYIRTARAKGLPEQGVLWGHALKNSLIPLITVAGVQVGYLLGGAVVTEEVFTLPGVGRLLLWAVFQRDYPLVQGTILVISGLFLVSNLIVDLVYAYLDPRIHYG
ncbi:MAG: glutathione ABC transporter permease GsiC [Candidatus Rokuibacteriota bacterium]|nr:MAG: glutathione ABC transporter permease GsiC [Candidatus Rokubacteria bacterium]